MDASGNSSAEPHTARTRAAERLLIACVREHDWTQPPGEAALLLPVVNQDQLLDLADRHRVTPAVATSLLHCDGLRDDVRGRLRQAGRAAAVRQLHLEAELQHLAAILTAIPWLVVKGPALARGYYRRPELRTYADLDVLVPPTHLRHAVQTFEANDYRLLDRNWTLLARELSGELHLLSSRGVMIDLHWDLFNDRATRDSYAMDTSTFFARSTALALSERLEVRTLDPLDTIVHTAVHAARAGGDRLVWMKDLEQLVLGRQHSWKELGARSSEHHAQLAVAVMLQRMRDTLAVAEMTDDALRHIGGAYAWRALGRAVDRLSPVASARPDGSLSRMYARATRADSRTTVRELGRRLTARIRRGAWAEPDFTWDASHPNSVLFNAGGDTQRATFFDAVTSGLAMRDDGV